MDPKSTPSHGKCIPLSTPFEESVVGKFHLKRLGDQISMFRGYLCMTPPLKLPNMVCHVLLKVKDGHLSILTNCPFPSFWPELPKCLDLKSMMMVSALKYIYIKIELRKKEKECRIGALNIHYCGYR